MERERERACRHCVCVHICVCLSSGINRSLFRSRSSWRMPHRHVVTRASLLFECGADIGCRYAAPALNIRSISPPPPPPIPPASRSFSSSFQRSSQPPYSCYVCLRACHVFRLSANPSSPPPLLL